MSGLENETDLLCGHQILSPSNSKINFACPSESVLRDINPLGKEFPAHYQPGIIMPMIDLKASQSNEEKSYILMFDGKKVRKGGDVDLLGFEDGASLEDKKREHAQEIEDIALAIKDMRIVSRTCKFLQDTSSESKDRIFEHVLKCFQIISVNLRKLRELLKTKSLMLRRLKDQSVKNTTKSASFAYAIDLCRTVIYQIENCLSSLLDIQRVICKSGAALNNVENLFPT